MRIASTPRFEKQFFVLNLTDMGGGLPPIKRQLIATLIASGTLPKEITETAKCSRRTVFNYKHNLSRFEDTRAQSISKVGRPSALTQEMEKVSICHVLSSVKVDAFQNRVFCNFWTTSQLHTMMRCSGSCGMNMMSLSVNRPCAGS